MLQRSRARAAALVTVAVLAGGVATGRLDAQSTARAGGGITTPKEHFGFDIGDDYCLANYKQLAEYWQKLEAESDRLKLVEIGKTEEGRPQLMAIVTSPANQKRLDRYREIARRLALAEGLDRGRGPAARRRGQGGGLDRRRAARQRGALCAQALIETVYQFVSRQRRGDAAASSTT